ncbi:23S rRNA (pseudouridine(1915)-N(3))-methyltransferase RlmH [Prevotella pallens]|jgi:putative rRNA large subunit m3Psi methyltransferase rlmH|uniref:23S rRNA (pseudouridine(1915)-N(3))-methyltransferase RlmH n=1 Tax=Prevotella pallens TaxID=60133 RepID=UPI001CAD8B3F|nr:23S rRNA (pseudouridine(1915)-N(3))-methyltransferase RlmH [Prevotella pallens]MBF1465493.1 23S rRNA (pseudouridine(1915)-N(3))-methyltransferase RlmH [Prevotella pallens]MBF1517944.1 23S rRNA (pseudouridine(1915)-N(3))-methyltransferase RlmH [Prevotella pallens]
MKATLILVGRTNNELFAHAIADYVGRIGHYIPFKIVTIPELKNTKKLSEAQQKIREGETILREIQTADTVVLLDEHGKEFRSIDFAAWLQKKQNTAKHLVFVIGGAYGFSEAVYSRANEKISLSKMTFSHQMVRLIFVEQLYRACSIIRGEPYHHE